jgi:hypothetical protein
MEESVGSGKRGEQDRNIISVQYTLYDICSLSNSATRGVPA